MHLSVPGRSHLVVAAVTALALAVVGCPGCDDEVDEPPPWKFTSERAPYEVIFPSEWSRESSNTINPNSDLEAHREQKLFFLVIPQELPDFPAPDLLQFKEQGLRSLDESVDHFVVRRRGALELDGVSGLTVFADGEFEDESISYITSYAISDGVGYQIIAFGSSEYESELFEDVDLILSHWQFLAEDEKEDATSTDDIELHDEVGAPGSLPEFDDEDESGSDPPSPDD